ncbi:uncharacterized protein K452DRAFT_331445 [Aplosporella prunicola CBS 121167]|uniref:Uncharacterized protein n=1 Tax=Aplosporella prunicola CBS 121167 TaxID=1176127 RepID=A0A6A6BJZ9_9PEZI|nr:uncharacterized protein K452DRAFT_331445 [Aplosporella prunicola CBS 121167]KAF2142881.1 hypothetical protein K452DRAFT_331445 [Aplosporella prunicola CBS 121167]
MSDTTPKMRGDNNTRADMLKRMGSQTTLGQRVQLSGALQREILDDEIVDLATILKDAPPMPDLPASFTSQTSPEVSQAPKTPENLPSAPVNNGKNKKKRKSKSKSKLKGSDPSSTETEEIKEGLQSWKFMNKKARDPPVTKDEKSSPTGTESFEMLSAPTSEISDYFDTGLQQKEEKEKSESEDSALEAIRLKLRQQLANTGGFCYNSKYEFAHLRTAPPPEKPAPPAPPAPTNTEVETEPEGMKTPTNKGKEAPAAQGSSPIGLGLDMSAPSTAKDTPSMGLSGLSLSFDDTSSPPDGPADEQSSPTRFLQPTKPIEVSPMTLFPPYRFSQESTTPKQLLADPIHPYADLWAKFSKPTEFRLSEDPENHAAYMKIRNELIECWMVATGQKNAPPEVLRVLSGMLLEEEKLRMQKKASMPPSEPVSAINSPTNAGPSFTGASTNSRGRNISRKLNRTFNELQRTPGSGVQSTINTPPSKSASFPVETSVVHGGPSPRINTTRKVSNAAERPRLAMTPQTPMSGSFYIPSPPTTFSDSTKASKSAPLSQLPFEKGKTLKTKRSFSFASINKNKDKSTPTLSATSMFFKKSKSSRSGSITSEESLLNKHIDDLLYAVNAWYTTGGQKSQENPITLLAQMALKVAQSVLDQANTRFSSYLYPGGTDDEDGEERMSVVQENMTRQIESLLIRCSMDETRVRTYQPSPPKPVFSHDYLQAGYECTWAVRFCEWTEEQEELRRFIDQEENKILYGTSGTSGTTESFRKPDRTKELMEKLSWVTYSSQPDYAVNISVEEAEQRLQHMRAENHEQDDVWMKCEEQLCKLTGLISSI